MYAILVFITLFFALVQANVRVQVDVEDTPKASYYGKDVHVITDQEADLFKLSDQNIKNAINAFFGRAPEWVYLHSPTPWGDLYKLYKWREVHTNLSPISAKINERHTVPVVVLSQVFINNSTSTGTFDVAISQTVENRVEETWSSDLEMSVGTEISVDIGIVKASTSFSMKTRVGQSQTVAKSMTIGMKSGMKMDLKPGQAVKAELSATKGVMVVDVRYRASLDGQVASCYYKFYKNHGYWGFAIGILQLAGGLPTNQETNQLLEISYYSEGLIKVYDLDINQQLL